MADPINTARLNETSTSGGEVTRSSNLGELQTLAGAIHQGRAVGRSFSAGDRIDRYEVVNLIGSGGFSNVYWIRHRYLEQEFALKTLREAEPTTEQSERFLREARTLALLNHPSVLRVYDANITADGVPFIITELLAGETLRQITQSGARMPAARLIDLLEEMAEVLILQEQLGVIHRDIKPSNIFQRNGGPFCLFDYTSVGLDSNRSRQHEAFETMPLTITAKSGPTLGTPVYMAPEQFESDATAQSDLYCLGMTAWECLVGRTPRPTDAALPELSRISRLPVPMEEAGAGIPREIAQILRNLLEPRITERYQSARELLNDLQDFLYDGSPPAGPRKGNCFVAIPFRHGFRRTFDAIRSASAAVHLRARRMDEITFVSDIWGQIEQEITSASVVVADFTRMGWRHQPNPNVITEAAHARAIDKALIIITRDAPETLPFDWRHMPVLRYRNTKDGLVALESALITKLRRLSREPTAHAGPPASA